MKNFQSHALPRRKDSSHVSGVHVRVVTLLTTHCAVSSPCGSFCPWFWRCSEWGGVTRLRLTRTATTPQDTGWYSSQMRIAPNLWFDEKLLRRTNPDYRSRLMLGSPFGRVSMSPLLGRQSANQNHQRTRRVLCRCCRRWHIHHGPNICIARLCAWPHSRGANECGGLQGLL
jgi:hypothetical protein